MCELDHEYIGLLRPLDDIRSFKHGLLSECSATSFYYDDNEQLMSGARFEKIGIVPRVGSIYSSNEAVIQP